MTHVSAHNVALANTGQPGRSPAIWSASIAAVAYAVLVVIMWAPYTLFSGLGYETAFPYMSETGKTLLSGFLYRGDPLRIHTNTFYHLAYLLGEAAGVGGSFVPYQIVYAALWWARGFLVFLLVRKFFPREVLAAFVAGAIVIVHASDRALQWVGQMNQFGFIFWMLLACYGLTNAAEDGRSLASVRAWALLASVFCYMSLWSYESQLLLIMLFPVALVIRAPKNRRTIAVVSAWYVVPAIYLVMTVQKYTAGEATYQAEVMRHNWALGTLASDWWFNIAASVTFWNWPLTRRISDDAELALWAIAVVVIAVAILLRVNRARNGPPLTPERRIWLTLFAAGVVALVFSFPAYLLLDSARGLWRTQFLSGIGAALTLTALFGLVASRVPGRGQGALLLVLACPVIWFGSNGAMQRGATHRADWERQRSVVREILTVAPRVEPGTMIVVMNVPKNGDPFGHNMWLDLALRLAYPHTPVAGLYFYPDGTPSPGSNLKVDGNEWKWDGTEFPPAMKEIGLDQTVVIALNSGKATLAPALPGSVCPLGCASELYQPSAMISGPVSPRAARRYRLNAPAP